MGEGIRKEEACYVGEECAHCKLLYVGGWREVVDEELPILSLGLALKVSVVWIRAGVVAASSWSTRLLHHSTGHVACSSQSST